MWLLFIFILRLSFVFCKTATDPPPLFKDLLKYKDVRSVSDFVFWPNATIPFYINESNFDSEQTATILKALHNFKTVSCLKFIPVVAPPLKHHLVMLFQNPTGEKLCNIRDMGRQREHNFIVDLGYKCLETPRLEMIIMRALGFPFEHNRMIRDVFVDVQKENIMQEYLGLFDKEGPLPADLSNLRYDTSSVLHFDEFEYTKNGHRTIIVRDWEKPHLPQPKLGLSELDIKKIQIVYGPECRKRERAEKLEVCKIYAPAGSKRRKRSLEVNSPPVETTEAVEAVTEKAVVANITVPVKKIEAVANRTAQIKLNKGTFNIPRPATTAKPENSDKEHSPVIIFRANDPKNESSEEFNIKSMPNEVNSIVENIEILLDQALIEAKQKHCSGSEPYIKANTTAAVPDFSNNTILAVSVLDVISERIQEAIKAELSNLTKFCEDTDTKSILRMHCIASNDPRCRQKYFLSTKQHKWRYTTFLVKHFHHSTDQPRHYHHFLNGQRRKREAVLTETNDDHTENPKQIQVTWTKVVSVDNNTEDIKENAKKWEYNTDNNRRFEPSNVEPFSSINDDVVTPRGKRFQVKSSNIRNPDEEYEPEELYNRDRNRFKVANSNAQQKKDVETEEPKKQLKSIPRGSPIDSDSISIENKKPLKSPKKQKAKQKVVDAPKTKDDNQRSVEDEHSNEEIQEIEESPVEKKTKNKKQKNKPKHDKKRKQEKPAERQEVHIPDVEDLPDVLKLPKENFEFYNERMWPGGVVPYFIVENDKYDIDSLRGKLKEVADILKEKTCVRLKEIGEGDLKRYKDYLVLDSKQRDYVTGKVGGRQIFGSVELFQGGQHRQFTAMMVMAMLGFYFEVARTDRDKYIRVHSRHVRPDKLHHFEKIREGATMPLPYDYESATHPAWQFWRKIGKTGISTVATYKNMDPDGKLMKRLGQHKKLFSKIDIIKINTVYGLKCREKRVHKKDKRGGDEETSEE